jgi:hypothetical protein
MAPNPEAIAWYVQRSEDLLDRHRGRVEALRSRGGQLAGFSGAILALAGANAEAVLGALHGPALTGAGGLLLIGSICLVAALVLALRGAMTSKLVVDISVEEIANYTTDRFINEPDLWRVQMRTIRGLLTLIDAATLQGDATARMITRAQYLFLVGLFAVGNALGILVAVMTF